MNAKPHRRIMIVDDNITNLTAGRNLLKNIYDVYPAPSVEMMFRMLEKVCPDLILLDINMPGIDGYAAMKMLKADERFAGIPVMFLTARSDEPSELKGFDLGAVDYISKPFSPARLVKRIENQFLIIQQRAIIKQHAENLEGLVQAKSGEILNLQNRIIATMAEMIELRDKFTGGHIMRTEKYMGVLMDSLEKKGLYREEISSWEKNFLLRSAQLHDVGKIAIPDAILNKPGEFVPEEFEIMKGHVAAGVEVIRHMIGKTSGHVFLRHALLMAGTHHEKWDGTGYPEGIKGTSIPLEGRLMIIADVYDALISERPYKKAFTHEVASGIIREGSGTYFDPQLVELFIGIEDKFGEIAAENA